MVLAEKGDPKFIAADLLAQAEHDRMASAILVTTNKRLKEENLSGYITVTGQTGIDTLLQVAKKIKPSLKYQILVTLHRRENLGNTLKDMLYGIEEFLDHNPNFDVL